MPTQEDYTNIASYPWSQLVNYERAEAVREILQKLSLSFFRKDTLKVVEREETVISASQSASVMNSLLIFGHVGHIRQEAFLSFLRAVRLRNVKDVASSVSVGAVVGDTVPHCFLEPLVESCHTKALRRWHRVSAAARCGIFYKIEERRRKVRDRLDGLLKDCVEDPTSGGQKAFERAAKDFYGSNFYDLADEPSSEHIFAPLSVYDAATKETRVDLSLVAASVPTLFIAWSYLDSECLVRLREMLFNGSFLNEFRAKTSGLASRFATVIEGDPWVELVKAYVEVRNRPTRSVDTDTLTLLPLMMRRAQIVMVNVDRDAKSAHAVYDGLVAELGGFQSPEVSLLSLWVGKRGLQSEFCSLFRTSKLPQLLSTQPYKRSSYQGPLAAPRLVYAPVEVYLEGVPPMSERLPCAQARRSGRLEPDAPHWHQLPEATRTVVAHRMATFISQSDAPLSFKARVDRVYGICNPQAATAMEALRSEVSSSVSLKGRLCELDVQPILDDLTVLVSLQHFTFAVDFVKASAPLPVQLDAMTPRRIVKGHTRTVTCTYCSAIVTVNLSPHYRCIHCEQERGLLCESCFLAKPAIHPEHHIILRIPPNVVSEVRQLPLLWGPSNLTPLPLFRGVLITNNIDTHLGVYCDRCRAMIVGKRWKCSKCYDYDLCDLCYAHRCVGELEHISHFKLPEVLDPASTPLRSHEPWHPMLCISHGRDGDNNSFIRPTLVPSLRQYIQEQPGRGAAVPATPLVASEGSCACSL